MRRHSFECVAYLERSPASPTIAARLGRAIPGVDSIHYGLEKSAWITCHMQEDDARTDYAILAGVDPQRVGFILNGNKGASPD
jgi:hypothetical protein